MFDRRAGYPSVVPYVRYRDPAAAIIWLSAVLGGHEAIRMTLPDGKVGHAELVVGSHVIAVGLAPTANGAAAPPGRGPSGRSELGSSVLLGSRADRSLDRACRDTPRVVSCGPAMNRRTETQSVETDARPADVLALLADPQRSRLGRRL